MKVLNGVLNGIGLLLVTMTLQSCSSRPAGPNGGDVVTLNNSRTKAEIVANADTGEIMVQTWDQNLKNKQAISDTPLMIGSADHVIALQPHPTASDPRGLCSRFYGQADWLRGGQVHHGWLGTSAGQARHEFAWDNCWRGGETHGAMWNEMGEHRHGMMGGAPRAGMGRQEP